MVEVKPESAAVDWGKVDGDINCPLCDYNLRGLVEARCPECGYRFEWVDLMEPERRRHPYLFEHHPRRKVWSFYRTVIGGMRPGKFWTGLHPAQPSYKGRLVGYWVAANLALVLLVVPVLALMAIELTREFRASRGIATTAYNRVAAVRAQYPTKAAFDLQLDQRYPLPPSKDFFRLLWARSYDRGGGLVALVGIALFMMGWPWVVFLPLMIFRQSMGRAKVKTIHVVRCVVYCSDTTVWTVGMAFVWVVVLAAAMPMWMSTWSVAYRGNEVLELGAFGVVCLFLLVYAWRLSVAYKRYLKFDHSLATVVAAHVIGVLLIPAVLVVAIVVLWAILD
ncbi:MAG: hypothetical protein NTU53_04770 [Planctomycetota bacterium]|nr:hypothetical protein [Planctomycetota bacterium]